MADSSFTRSGSRVILCFDKRETMISRRHFVTALGAGMLGLSQTAGAHARFTLGIGTYTYRDVTKDEMIQDLKQLNIREIELSNPDYMLPAVTVPTVRSIRAKLDRAGITAVSFFCAHIKTPADLNLTVDVARALGVRHVSGWSEGQTLKMVDRRFTREGLKFGIHNHWYRGRRFEYESPSDLLRALAQVSDTVGVTLDTGHMASCGYNPVQALEKLWPRVQMVHLKDVARVNDDQNVILGTGIAKIRGVVALLKKRRFSHLVAIEYEAHPQNPQPDVARCVAFARKLM